MYSDQILSLIETESYALRVRSSNLKKIETKVRVGTLIVVRLFAPLIFHHTMSISYSEQEELVQKAIDEYEDGYFHSAIAAAEYYNLKPRRV